MQNEQSIRRNVSSTGYRYVFSIVMAVYNCAPFLGETLDSVIKQNLSRLYEYKGGKRTNRIIPFSEAVELIAVDDGSTDGSGEILDRYAALYPNIKVIHKENGGVASARNEGLRHAEGKYINFLDSDDKLSPNVLSSVNGFFEENYDRVDVVTIPIYFFDAFSAPHWQNYKFSKRSRVVDLYNEYDSPLMFVNASFFKAESVKGMSFDSGLVCGEDIKFISEILAEKMTLGLLSGCRYFYRRRSEGEESLIQSSKKKLGWYFDYFENLVDWCIDFAEARWGTVPLYYQNILVCDLKWRFLNEYEQTALTLLGKEGFERYKSVLYASLRHFDDKVILAQRGIYMEHKYMMLEKKYSRLPEKCIYSDDVRLRYGDTLLWWLSSCYTVIDFIDIRDGKLFVEGYTTVLGISEDEPFDVYLSVRKRGEREPILFPTKKQPRDASFYKLSETLFRAESFLCELPLSDIDWAELSIVCIWDGNRIVKKDIRYGSYSPIGNEYGRAYYYSDGYLVTRKEHFLYVEVCTRREHLRRARRFVFGLFRSERRGDKKAALALIGAAIYRFFKRRRLWLIMDRPDSAGDNGEALFRYLRETKPKGVDVRFVLERSSPDFKRLREYGKVVPYRSHKHKMLYLISDAVISSHADEFVIYPFHRDFMPPYRNYVSKKPFIFLQHGITKADLSRFFSVYKINARGFVTAGERERDSILSDGYHYSAERVWLTGFARYDYLENKPQRVIAVMPTWRAYLVDGYLKLPDRRLLDSDFYRFYKALFSDVRLAEALKSRGYEMRLKLHPRMAEYRELFEREGVFDLYPEDKAYREIIAEGSLLVTDYSSVSFDFAYLEKPLIYCQFDRAAFYSGDHTVREGYFDERRDGFGEVTETVEDTVDRIISYLDTDCKPKEEYIRRKNSFFAFSDRENSKRIVGKILEINSDK